ncbi:WD-40 repeat-containing protein [Coprinopsis sp. MPI-PUGE-AT-0042]|nr:WD-40 repeat-containing protein [Coprinopsis sp. MPI-PUGE-AT-0042]
MSKPPAPAPTHLLRSHTAGITAIHISGDNERLYSADGQGKVTLTSTRTLRAIAVWNAHTDSVLGIEEFGSNIATTGRDNKLHIWKRITELLTDLRVGGSATLSTVSTPALLYSMDINALNYCRFSLVSFPPQTPPPGSSSTKLEETERALIALPNLIDSSTADIWSLPSQDRLHAAIGQEGDKPIFAAQATAGRGSAGITMALHLYLASESEEGPDPLSDLDIPPTTRLRLLCAYENGSVVLRKYIRSGEPKSIEGRGWDTLWKHKGHVETIMAMAVSSNHSFALTVSADHLVVRYNLSEETTEPTTYRIKNPGNASVSIRHDGRVCAIGGWDGSIRLFSTKSFKPLGTLKYHKASVQAMAFARPLIEPGGEGNGLRKEDDEDDFDTADKANRARWLIAGSKDNRVSIWSLMDF